MPGYTIDHNVPGTMLLRDENGKHVFEIDDDHRNLVVDYIKECYKLVRSQTQPTAAQYSQPGT